MYYIIYLFLLPIKLCISLFKIINVLFFLAPGMQKSRSSTNVQQGFMSKRIWKGRSKSQTRTNAVASPWTPLVSIYSIKTVTFFQLNKFYSKKMDQVFRYYSYK